MSLSIQPAVRGVIDKRPIVNPGADGVGDLLIHDLLSVAAHLHLLGSQNLCKEWQPVMPFLGSKSPFHDQAHPVFTGGISKSGCVTHPGVPADGANQGMTRIPGYR